MREPRARHGRATGAQPAQHVLAGEGQIEDHAVVLLGQQEVLGVVAPVGHVDCVAGLAQ